MHLEFLNKTRKTVTVEFFEPLVKKGERVIVSRIQKLCGRKSKNLVLSLTLVNDKEMAPIHEAWRGKKGPTDVLSFSYVEKSSAFLQNRSVRAVGDIVISVDMIAKQAKKKKRSFSQELAIMFVHGFLHIFGYDHETDQEEAEMEAEAKKILV